MSNLHKLLIVGYTIGFLALIVCLDLDIVLDLLTVTSLLAYLWMIILCLVGIITIKQKGQVAFIKSVVYLIQPILMYTYVQAFSPVTIVHVLIAAHNRTSLPF